MKKIIVMLQVCLLTVAVAACAPANNEKVIDSTGNESEVLNQANNSDIGTQEVDGEADDSLTLPEETGSALIAGGLYDGNEQIEISEGTETVTATWHTDVLMDYGLYLTDKFEIIKFEDGSDYEHRATGATISFLDMNVEDLSNIIQEEYLTQYSDYVGTEIWGDNDAGRTVYFQYQYDEDHHILIRIRYHVTGDGLVEEDCLQVVSTVKFKSNS